MGGKGVGLGDFPPQGSAYIEEDSFCAVVFGEFAAEEEVGCFAGSV